MCIALDRASGLESADVSAECSAAEGLSSQHASSVRKASFHPPRVAELQAGRC